MAVRIENTFQAKEPVERVWDLLSDPRKVVNFVPGAQITEAIDDRTFKGSIRVKVGPSVTDYKGQVHIERLDAETHEIEMVGKGQDVRGKGSASMKMTGSIRALADGGSEVSAVSEVNVVGLLAQLGSRMIQDVSAVMFKEFVKRFQAQLEQAPQSASSVEQPASPPQPVDAAAVAGAALRDAGSRLVHKIFGGSDEPQSTEKIRDIEDLVRGFEQFGYVLDHALATAVYLLLKLGKPLLIEGHAGVGKTEVAKVLAQLLGAGLIRLQCYEGLDVSSAVYEWNYQKQLLAIKIQERTDETVEEKVKHIFGPEFLLERPLLRSIRATNGSPVLLVDEIDRSDEAFEAFLLELLSDFQISVPEMGTLRATHRPYVVLTSNRTRELSDALKRRCLYHWIDYPSLEKEMKIVRTRLPNIQATLSAAAVTWVQALRQMDLIKPPGVAETLDCVQALDALGRDRLDRHAAGRNARLRF